MKEVKFRDGSHSESQQLLSPHVSLAMAFGGVAGYAMFTQPALKNASLGAALLGMGVYAQTYFGNNTQN